MARLLDGFIRNGEGREARLRHAACRPCRASSSVSTVLQFDVAVHYIVFSPVVTEHSLFENVVGQFGRHRPNDSARLPNWCGHCDATMILVAEPIFQIGAVGRALRRVVPPRPAPPEDTYSPQAAPAPV